MLTNKDNIAGIKKDTVNINDENCIEKLEDYIYNYIENHEKKNKDIVVICIGTDRATGDSLGPLLGTFLSKRQNITESIKIYGTLDKPVHAKNIDEVLWDINNENSLIVAIDASLGEFNHVGNIRVAEGCLLPGAGVGKNLPPVGDISITCNVNVGVHDSLSCIIIQNTRLSLVYRMAESLDIALSNVLKNILNEQNLNLKVVNI